MRKLDITEIDEVINSIIKKRIRNYHVVSGLKKAKEKLREKAENDNHI